MSTRFIVSAVVGAVVGFATYNPYAGAQAFSITYAATGSLDPAVKQYGPRLEDLKGTKAAYGEVIVFVRGHPRVAGNIAWSSEKREVATTSEEDGKGGPGVETTTFTYEQDLLIILCEQAGYLPRRIWSNGKLVWSAADTADGETIEASQETDAWRELRAHPGAADQMPDPTYEAAIGAGFTPANRGRSTVMLVGVNLGSSGYPPQLTIEISNGEVTTASTGLMYLPLSSDYTDEVSAPGGAVVTPDGDVTFEDGRAVLTYDSDEARISWVKDSMDAAISDNPTLPVTVSSKVTLLTAGEGSASESSAIFMTGVPPAVVTINAWVQSSVVNLYYNVFRQPPQGPAGGSLGESLQVGIEREIAIVFGPDGDDTVDIYIDGVNKAHVGGMTLRAPLRGYVGVDAAGSAFVESMQVRDVRIFLGDEPNDTEQVGLLDAPLPDVIEEQFERAGLQASDVDASALAGRVVRSYGLGQIAAPRATLEMLSQVYRFDYVDDGERIVCVPRGGASVATIDISEMGATAGGESPEPLPITRSNDIEVAAQVVVNYSNVDNDYQDGSERSDRLSTGSSIVQTVQAPIGMTSTEAVRVANAIVQDIATSLVRIGPIALDRRHAALLPADVANLRDQYGRLHRARLTKRTDAGGVLTFEAVVDNADAAESTAETNTGYVPSETVRKPTPAELQVHDIPILRDQDDYLGQYAAMTWDRGTSATLFEAPDLATYAQRGTVTRRATMGLTLDALGGWTGGNVFDEVNTVQVDVGAGELESYTRDQVLAGTAPGYVIGSELLFACDADLQSPGVYVLSRLLRGQRGTEWAMGSHAAGDRVLRLSNDGLLKLQHQASDLGVDHAFKAVTGGLRLADAEAVEAADTGVAKRPFAPINVRAARTAGGLQLTWDRRSRLAMDWLAGTIPLGEETEAYEVDIVSGSTVLRTITGITSPAATYTSVQQTADGVTDATALTARVYQMSATVGRGYPGSVTTTGGYASVAGEVTVTVGGTFAAGRLLHVIVNGVMAQHLTVSGDTDLAGAATALAAAVDALAGVSASAAGAVITIEADAGGPLSVLTGVTEPSIVTQPYTLQIASGVSAGAPEVWDVSLAVVGAAALPPGRYRIRLLRSVSGAAVDIDADYQSLTTLGVTSVLAGLVDAINTGDPNTLYGITASNYGSFVRVQFATGEAGWSAMGLTVTMDAPVAHNWGGDRVQAASPVVPAPQPQITYVGIAGTVTAGDTYHVTVNGTTIDKTAVGGDTAASIAASLTSSINALPAVSAADATGTTPPGLSTYPGLVRITGDANAVPFTISTSTDATMTLTVSVVTEGA